jgi:hypothetical protein
MLSEGHQYGVGSVRGTMELQPDFRVDLEP